MVGTYEHHYYYSKSGSCSCKMFDRLGLLCRHMLLVLKDVCLSSIPLNFMVGRWTKDASLKAVFVVDGTTFEDYN